MKDIKIPDGSSLYPIPGYDREIYVKPSLKNPNITVGDFTYIADTEFESHVTNFYPWSRDRLIIGKFCQIAAGVEFVMNDANHQMSAVSTYPFYTADGWDAQPPPASDMPFKGDTVIGNDVWIGQNATILPGVRIGDGAIIGLGSVVGSDVPAYTVVAGNPARPIRKRFDDALIALLEKLRWWDLPADKIKKMIPVLTSSDLEKVRREIEKMLAENEYGFYGWQTADVKPVDPSFARLGDPRGMYDALSGIWCADTCAPRMRDGWTPANKTLGQCSITAFLAQDIFGGKVYGVPLGDGNFHCYNVVDGVVFDLTSEQFGDTLLDYSRNPEQLRETHFSKEEKRLRYEYLKRKLLEYCKK